MPIAPEKVDPLVSELMKLHPEEGETVLLSAKAEFYSKLLFGEDAHTGICLATNYRFGVVANDQELYYTINPYWEIRDFYVEDDFTLHYRLCGENYFDLSEDSLLTIKFEDDNQLDIAVELMIRAKYANPCDQIVGKLSDIYQQMYRGDYPGAMQQLQMLKELDPNTGLIDLWMAKLLQVTGKPAEAVSHVARGGWKALLAHPQSFFSEYLWYPWHSGALRLLPALSELTDERWEVQRYLLQAIQAKAQGNLEQFVKNSCLAFMSYAKEKETFEPCWIHFATNSQRYMYPSTRSYLHEALLLIADRYEEQIGSEEATEEASAGLFRATLLGAIEEDHDYVAWLQAFQDAHNDEQLRPVLLLAKEQFTELAACKSTKPELDIPESWDMDEFLGDHKLRDEYDAKLTGFRDIAYRTIGAARTQGITSHEVKTGLFQLMDQEYLKKLDMLEEEVLGFLVTLLIVEQHMAYGRREQALLVMQQWKRKYGHFLGLMSEPYLAQGDVIFRAYEAWALGNVKQISRALEQLPASAPFQWIHDFLRQQISALEMDQSAYNDESEVLGGMQQASGLAKAFASSTWLDTSMRNKAEEFHLLLQDKMQEADSLQRGRSEVAAGLELEAAKPAKPSWFSKAIGWFSGRKETAQVYQEPIIKPSKLIKIAIAGESSAGKTTLLNVIFRTNLFFVTQEEATGVPTEIKFAERMRIEVWDKSGQLRNTLETEPTWFEADGTTLLEQHLSVISSFLMQHTKVGSPALEWVERVVVYAPLEKLPPHVALVDTPGFNADARRTSITETEMKSCHMCMYIMDARNALKGKEISTLELIREEAGKTFILLNKMDLVLGDDELDCDGGDAADETVARVRRDLAAYFHLPDVVVYPISSMPREQLNKEAHRYADHLHEVMDAIFSEAEHQQVDLIIDASAKKAIEVHQGIEQTFAQTVEGLEQEIDRLEKAVPQDFTIYEDQVQRLVSNSISKYRSEFIDTMVKELNDSFQGAADAMLTWMEGVTSASTLKNEVQGQATQLLQNALTHIDRARQRELERMGSRIAEEAASFLQELYNNLPFPTTFDSRKFLSSMSMEQMTTSAELQTELSQINYGNGLNGGSVAGAIVGTFLLGPIGTVIGGFLGQLLGGKSLGDVKQEVYDTYVNTINQTWDQVADIIDQDLSEARTASFMNRLNETVQHQLEACKRVVHREIITKERAVDEQLSALIRLQLSAHQLQRVMDLLRQWRMVRRSRLG
jgi:GTP-binding protein EngB required for normal cell division